MRRAGTRATVDGMQQGRAPLVCGIAAIGLASFACGPSELFPDIVLITIDTRRVDRVSAYGHVRETTPTLDALARGGVRFENAYSSSSWTAPSAASLLTSLQPASHGVETGQVEDAGLRLPRQVVEDRLKTHDAPSRPRHRLRHFVQVFGPFEPVLRAPMDEGDRLLGKLREIEAGTAREGREHRQSEDRSRPAAHEFSGRKPRPMKGAPTPSRSKRPKSRTWRSKTDSTI